MVNSLDLKMEVRRAQKLKKHTDAIVYLDPLTEIGNRNRLLEDSAVFIRESCESRIPISVGLVDIDYFKECNDTYGHREGDECLILITERMQPEDLMGIGKEIQERIASLQIPNERSPISDYVTISQGYTRAVAEADDTIEKLIEYVDHVLYAVKRYGRNGYRVASLKEIGQGII